MDKANGKWTLEFTENYRQYDYPEITQRQIDEGKAAAWMEGRQSGLKTGRDSGMKEGRKSGFWDGVGQAILIVFTVLFFGGFIFMALKR